MDGQAASCGSDIWRYQITEAVGFAGSGRASWNNSTRKQLSPHSLHPWLRGLLQARPGANKTVVFLLTAVNVDGKTPLLAVVTNGHYSLASVLLGCRHDQQLNKAVLKQDRHGCNALHHAIRIGRKDLALELRATEPALSRAVNEYNESPMFIAVLRGYTEVFEKLLKIQGSAHSGTMGYNALHAAVKYGHIGQTYTTNFRSCLVSFIY